MTVTYHPEAEAELLEAARYYEDRMPGLGHRFLREFDEALEKVAIAPERWQLVEGTIRRYSMRRFPYGIYYRMNHDELRVLVVKHHHRHPDYWKARLDEL